MFRCEYKWHMSREKRKNTYLLDFEDGFLRRESIYRGVWAMIDFILLLMYR